MIILRTLEQNRFFYISFGGHLLICCSIYFLLNLSKNTSEPKVVKFKVIERPSIQRNKKEVSISIGDKTKRKISKRKKKVRKVYGMNRRSHTSSSEKSVAIKKGNTITKEIDQKKLKRSDVDELPIPKAEYLVTEMPSIISQAKIIYPEKAKQLKLEGVVVLSVLIDDKGNVRDANIVEGLIEEMDVEALRAIKLYKFAPARVEEQNVAVRIRYAIKFVLENN